MVTITAKSQWIFTLMMIFFCSVKSSAQPLPGLPLNPGQSPLFGKDIVINPQTDKDQRHVAVCSAFNGWLYAVQSYVYNNYIGYSLLRSEDNGISWTTISTMQSTSASVRIIDYNILACGKSEAELKVYLSYIVLGAFGVTAGINLDKHNGITGQFENTLLLMSPHEGQMEYQDLKLVSNTQVVPEGFPYNIGVAYSVSCFPTTGSDSLVFISSDNGGFSMNHRQVIDIDNSKEIRNLTIAYGNSPSFPTGKYFLAYEKVNDLAETNGHIYSTSTISDLSGPFSTPVCLDCNFPEVSNRCSKPAISCSYNTTDNNSGNITSAIVYQKDPNSGTGSDVSGFYNLLAATGDSYQLMDLRTTSNNEIQPDITFNPYTNEFFSVYFDSTSISLGSQSKNFNFINPNSWSTISTKFNDSINIIAPYPRVAISEEMEKPIYVWNSEISNGLGRSMFDAEYSTYTGDRTVKPPDELIDIKVYPNPCDQSLTLIIPANRLPITGIVIHDQLGNLVFSEKINESCPSGSNRYEIDTSTIKNGLYYASVFLPSSIITQKIMVIH